MKKHLVIICGIFYPDPSPTGLCAKRFAGLLADKYDIDIICLSENDEQGIITLSDGIKVHKLAGHLMSAESRSNGIKKKILHVVGCIQIKTRLLANLTWFRKAVYRKLNDIHAEQPIDTVFSICSPFAAHCAAMDFKRFCPSVHWCGYTVDPYAAKNRIRPFWCSYKKLVKKERTVLLSMDNVLLSEEVAKCRKELYVGCRNVNELPYMLPELNIKEGERCFFDEGDINCVYAGSFYKDIRNPEYMLNVFSRIKNTNIKLHLFSRGCEDIVTKYVNASSNIVAHKPVSAAEISGVYRGANILISVGNAVSEFTPSKTFEYISAGKPIINFYYNGLRNEVFEKYPLILQLCNDDNIDDAAVRVENFAERYADETVLKEEILNKFSKHAPGNILNILDRAMTEKK